METHKGLILSGFFSALIGSRVATRRVASGPEETWHLAAQQLTSIEESGLRLRIP